MRNVFLTVPAATYQSDTGSPCDAAKLIRITSTERITIGMQLNRRVSDVPPILVKGVHDYGVGTDVDMSYN